MSDKIEESFLKMIDEIPNEPEKFSEERYFRLEQIVYNLMVHLLKGDKLNDNDVADYMHYLDSGEWK